MRTHTAMHALCGVVWERFASPVTGGNMEPGEGRLDFEIETWDPEDRQPLEAELNRQIAAARPVEVAFLPRAEADADPSLIRTKVSLLPPHLTEVRVVDIVGLDRQADGGTHVASTGEVGAVRISKVESKGRGFRRIRISLDG
jgi:misacylated tRNA(Ala) deacylase